MDFTLACGLVLDGNVPLCSDTLVHACSTVLAGNLKSGAELLAYMQYILNDVTPPAEHPLGVLTSLDRDTWTQVRKKLEAAGGKLNLVPAKSTNNRHRFAFCCKLYVNACVIGFEVDLELCRFPGNTDAYFRLNSAYFALCLDDVSPTDPLGIARNFLHGDGKNRCGVCACVRVGVCATCALEWWVSNANRNSLCFSENLEEFMRFEFVCFICTDGRTSRSASSCRKTAGRRSTSSTRGATVSPCCGESQEVFFADGRWNNSGRPGLCG